MSFFYGYLTGNRGITTRTGSIKSGIHAHIRSWNNDIHASLVNNDKNTDELILGIPTSLKIIRINNIQYHFTKKANLPKLHQNT